MFLLHSMVKIKELYLPSWSISVAHFNHNKRTPTDALNDLQLVQYWSNKYGIKLYHKELQLSSADQKSSGTQGGFQLYARNWRRKECLDIIKHDIRASSSPSSPREYCIVTGHQEDDQVESFLFRLLRGTHLSHLTPVWLHGRTPWDCIHAVCV